MERSEVLRLCLEGEDESEFVDYFSDKQRDPGGSRSDQEGRP